MESYIYDLHYVDYQETFENENSFNENATGVVDHPDTGNIIMIPKMA